MPEIEAEVVERVLRWCAEAGRQSGAAEVRAALAPLGWDELLAVKALLADPPPLRPLGPHALADLARGTPADVAAEREREGRYRAEDAEADREAARPGAEAPPAGPAARKAPRARSRARMARAQFVIHRARDRVLPPAEDAGDPRRPLEELLRPEGRSVLERMVRRAGASRARLAAALGEAYRGREGGAVRPEELEALLREHGLARSFERRERDEALHAVRAAGGLLAAAAASLGLDGPGLDAAIARLGIAGEVERIRDERRADLRGRATLGERARLLADEEPRLADLGLAAEFEADLRARLPEHVRALLASGEPILPALARTLSLPRAAAEALAARCGIDLAGRVHASAPAAERTGPAPARRSAQGGGPVRERPPAARRGGPGSAPRSRGAPAGRLQRAGAPGTSRPRVGGARPGPGAPRAAGPRPEGDRRGGPRPAGGPRAAGPRTTGSRPGPRSGPPRSGPPRSGAPRSGAPRSGAPRSGPPRAGAPGPRGPRGGGRRPR